MTSDDTIRDTLTFAAALGLIITALAALYRNWQERDLRRKITVRTNGISSTPWFDYSTHTPNDPPGTEYLVTDGCTNWTASYIEELGVFEPLDWSVTHFARIEPPKEKRNYTVHNTRLLPTYNPNKSRQ